ncbi:hypothetical protein RI367_007797 [Sorochytrium milnesiophthora]
MTSALLQRYATSVDDFSNVFKYETLPKPHYADDEILVKMKLRAVNPSDMMCAHGLYPGFRPSKFPTVIGFEGMGYVEAVGANIKNVKVGQKIVPLLFERAAHGYGTWQAYVVIKEQEALIVPDHLADEAAAQLIVNPLAILGFEDVLQLSSGQTLLQSAAASVLGRQLIQFCKLRGVKTVNLIRRNDQQQIKDLTELGADHVIHTERPHDEVVKLIKEATGGKGADAAVDAVAGDITELLTRSLKYGGRVLMYGRLSDKPTTISPIDVLVHNVRIEGFSVSRWMPTLSHDKQRSILEEVVKLYADRSLTPLIGTKFPITQTAEALKESLKPNRGGKVLLESD